ncbi:hypothetical protein DDT52_00480 [Brenneria roseae subsp. roseae]|uniref:hypothetical protein n=1 Tax=Brenneria roseae TaxID=1509241 RepID=UPI000D616622|nr:hypothetical protein [Brenneria roseae]PWC22785.1 hypothetical protein DDT52_00480 [Brenneria roseae subsp. roseae]
MSSGYDTLYHGREVNFLDGNCSVGLCVSWRRYTIVSPDRADFYGIGVLPEKFKSQWRVVVTLIEFISGPARSLP